MDILYSQVYVDVSSWQFGLNVLGVLATAVFVFGFVCSLCSRHWYLGVVMLMLAVLCIAGSVWGYVNTPCYQEHTILSPADKSLFDVLNDEYTVVDQRGRMFIVRSNDPLPGGRNALQ